VLIAKTGASALITSKTDKKSISKRTKSKISDQMQPSINGNGEPSEAKSIYRASLILENIAKDINSLSEIADASKLTRSTTHRLLKALAKSHLVVHDPVSRLYFLGPSITQFIAKPELTHEYLIRASLKEMEYLAELTEETIVLGVLIGLNHVSLHSIESRHELRVVWPRNSVGPLYSGAASKILLSLLSDAALKSIINKIQFEPLTEHTVTNKEDLMIRIKEIRKQGYAVTSSERVSGAISVAAPLKDYVLPAALSILGPESRMKPRMAQFTEKLVSAANRISQRLVDAFSA
jgi:DNA-binding IclR family transcriptional regulator